MQFNADEIKATIERLEQERERYFQTASNEVNRRLGDYDGRLAVWRELLVGLDGERTSASGAIPGNPDDTSDPVADSGK